MPGAAAPVDVTCRYDGSKLLFRGPVRDLANPYLACIGGTETFGRFVPVPFPERLESRLGMACVNLGSAHAGLEALSGDRALADLAARAERCILQLPGAQGVSNRFYRVHPRRNDRFIAASEDLAALYPEVDFTDIHFTGHLLARLRQLSPDRFEPVRAELCAQWRRGMRQMLDRLGDRTLLLWLQHQTPAGDKAPALGCEPLLVTGEMVSELGGRCAAVVTVPVRAAGESEELGDMIFGLLQEPAAEHMIGPATHESIAWRLLKTLRDLE